MSYKKNPRDQGTIRHIADFLFGKNKGESENQYLDRRTDISGREMFRALTLYRFIEEVFNSEASGQIGSVLERLSISKTRLGRSEGVHSIMGQFPKTETLTIGVSELLKKEMENKTF